MPRTNQRYRENRYKILTRDANIIRSTPPPTYVAVTTISYSSGGIPAVFNALIGLILVTRPPTCIKLASTSPKFCREAEFFVGGLNRPPL